MTSFTWYVCVFYVVSKFVCVTCSRTIFMSLNLFCVDTCNKWCHVQGFSPRLEAVYMCWLQGESECRLCQPACGHRKCPVVLYSPVLSATLLYYKPRTTHLEPFEKIKVRIHLHFTPKLCQVVSLSTVFSSFFFLQHSFIPSFFLTTYLGIL